jgi:hypothetical protein
MIDYPTALQAAFLVFFMVIGAVSTLGGLMFLVHRTINKSGTPAAKALAGVLGIFLVIAFFSVVFYYGGNPDMINGLVHGASAPH